MKKAAIIAIFLALGLIRLTPARAEPDNPFVDLARQLSIPHSQTADIDTIIYDAWPGIVEFQEEFFQRHGRYYQMLWSHSATPDTRRMAPDRLMEKPADQRARASSALWARGKFPATTPCRIRVDVYEGPHGHGFILIIQTRGANQTLNRMIEYGLERRTKDWWTVDD